MKHPSAKESLLPTLVVLPLSCEWSDHCTACPCSSVGHQTVRIHQNNFTLSQQQINQLQRHIIHAAACSSAHISNGNSRGCIEFHSGLTTWRAQRSRQEYKATCRRQRSSNPQSSQDQRSIQTVQRRSTDMRQTPRSKSTCSSLQSSCWSILTIQVLVSEHNRLSSSDSTYYDTTTSTSFDFEHSSQKLSNSKSYKHESSQSDLVNSISKSLATHFTEHYPSTGAGSAYTVVESDGKIAILISATKSSPSNFISGRWRTKLVYDPASKTLTGLLAAQVHYYEDGNVSLDTRKKVNEANISDNGAEIVRKVALLEKQYQEEVNKALVSMNEGSFRGLRRQLPVTRQRIEWEKIRGYSLSDNLKGK